MKNTHKHIKVSSLMPSSEERKTLERKVAEGTEKAVKEYREVFRRLAEHDKTS
ncbi:hypothetical protein HY477_00570 [Candidatus Uhrbacteria bacterium]|nr:hypothetical protein [Candidatus Uhrbacteria bacterium]